MRYFVLTLWALFAVSAANYPVFEGANQLKRLLIPAEVHIGSVIYRLRASDHDHDYPLQFDATDYGSYVVKVENLPCNVNSSLCEANVYLDRVLVAGQNFKFRFTVRDTKGDTTTATSSIEVTNTPVDITTIFPHMPGIIVIPEDTKVGTELEYVIVRKHPEHKKSAYLEIRSSAVLDFGRIRTTQETTIGVVTLMKKVDFETQNMYKLQIFALNMYADKLVDSRNIAGFDLLLIIEDVQDCPPVFTQVEPTTKLRSNFTQGDIITRVIAVDGDRGNPRQIKYGLVSESNPFTIFFNIDRITGQISMAKPLKQLMAITRSHQPILLTILAEEEKLSTNDAPFMSTTITIALLMDEADNTAPYFDNDQYVCYLNENSPEGTALIFSDAYSTQVHDDDTAKQGVFSLQLDKNNGTFEISPNVVERKAYFTLRVQNKQLLDYESRQTLHFEIVARELDPGSLSGTASVLVYLNDVNDNSPQFQKNVYMAQIPENVTASAFIVEVKATDVDTGLAGNVHYTRITGYRNSSLLVNSITGVISVAIDNHGFDREESSEYQMIVEARDMEGTGLLATASLIIRVVDVNDETPVFENMPFQFTLTNDMKNFSTRAFIKATDKDAEAPNNVVRYEIISGNYDNKFVLNSETGELHVRYSDGLGQLRQRRQILDSLNVYILTVRAYDLGVPHRWSTVQVKIFPTDSGTRLLNFVVPAKGLNFEKMEELLTKMTGGQVSVIDVIPYRANRHKRAIKEALKRLPSQQKNMVVARVTYADDSVVDVEQIYYLMKNTFASNTEEEDQVEVQRASGNAALYWIIVILILLLIALMIIALLCYLWKCCTCDCLNRQKNKISNNTKSTECNSKGVQANNRARTWSSSDSNRVKRDWNSYRQREPEPQPQPVLLIQKSPTSERRQYQNPNLSSTAFIYRTNLVDVSTMDRHDDDNFIHDVPETEYRILDPTKLNIRRVHKEHRKFNNSNIAQQEIGQPNMTPTDRDESFIREGNAEILRLQTNDSLLNMNNTNSFRWSTDPYQMQATLLPGDTGSRQSKQAQTDTMENQQNLTCIQRSVLDVPSYEPVPVINLQQESKIEKLANGVMYNNMSKTTNNDSRGTDANRNIPTESAPFKNNNSDETSQSTSQKEIFMSNLVDVSRLEEERNRLNSFQRDLLLTKLLVDEQQRCLNRASDTLSLPGSLSMGTQTDHHRATQTDILCLMRPEPRWAKSENDDSSDSDIDRVTSTRKISRRTLRIISKDKSRHKIRTPIMEESESTEILRRCTKHLQRENRTSLLRLCNNRNKIKDPVTNGHVENYNQVISKQRLRSYGTDSVKDKKSRISFKDNKKSVSYSNIQDACLIFDKEMYTPPLRSTIIARRSSVSEPAKIGIHCTGQKQQERGGREKCDFKETGVGDLNEKAEGIMKKDEFKRRLQHLKRLESEKDDSSPRPRSIIPEVADELLDLEKVTLPSTGQAILKLKSKNQPLMEKKSVFTIAYDDAATDHLGASSNGSNHE